MSANLRLQLETGSRAAGVHLLPSHWPPARLYGLAPVQPSGPTRFPGLLEEVAVPGSAATSYARRNDGRNQKKRLNQSAGSRGEATQLASLARQRPWLALVSYPERLGPRRDNNGVSSGMVVVCSTLPGCTYVVTVEDQQLGNVSLAGCFEGWGRV